MTDLVVPDPARTAELGALLRDYDDGTTAHGSGVWMVPPERLDLDDAAALRSWLRVLAWQADPASTYLDETVPSHYFWITDGEEDSGGGKLVGFLAFRHRLSPWLLREGGHVGYSVRPSRRREGHASRALGLAVRREAPRLGLDRVLVTCDLDNTASAATIERCGGVHEDEQAGKRRYWVPVPAAP